MVSRPLTIISLVLFILALVFHFAAIAGGFLVVLVIIGCLLLAIGVLVGK